MNTMPIDFSSGVGIQITNLVNSLDQKNYRNNVNEIEKVPCDHFDCCSPNIVMIINTAFFSLS